MEQQLPHPKSPEPSNQVVLVPRKLAQNTYAFANRYPVYPSSDDRSASQEVGLFEYWAILRQNRRKILVAGIIGLLAAFFISFALPRVYRAQASVEVLEMNQNFMNMKETNPVTISMDSDVSEEQTEAQLLTSASMIKRVTARLDSHAAATNAAAADAANDIDTLEDASSRTTPPFSWKSLFSANAESETAPTSRLLAKVASTLKATTKLHTRLIEVTADSSNPRLAAKFLNTLTDEFIKRDQESRLLTTQHTGDWLSKELNDARERLRLSEDALQQYARTSGIIFTDDTTNVATEKLQQYQQVLSAATADRVAKQSRFELAKSSAPESLGDILNDPTLRETQSKINDLKRQIADLSTTFNSKYPKLVHLRAQVDSLESDFSRQRADILAHITTDYNEATRKERLLASLYAAQTHEVTGQGEKAIQYNILKREVDSNRQLYDAMLQQMKQASIATAMRASNVRIVDSADVPRIPTFPNFKINALIGFLAGTFFSSFTVLIRSQADTTLQVPGEIKKWLDIPELGTIPNAAIAMSKAYYQPYDSRRSIPQGTVAHRNKAVELATSQKHPTLLGESFRSALSSILFVGQENEQPKVLAFTSAHPAEGKTTAVTNLAIAAADIRLKVLIIDADLRRPRIHEVFKLPNDRGLADILQSELTAESVEGAIHPSGVPNVHIMTAGSETRSAAHILSSPNLPLLLDELRNSYDMILIDTPPMMPMTDARIVGRRADCVVLIARAGRTTREVLTAAKNRLQEDSVHVLGSLLNDWNPKSSPKTYYKAYSSYKSMT